MAADNDQPAWLPDPPPPRPAARDAAIGAAMRRFDGVDAPLATPKPARQSRPRRNQPQMAMAMSAALLLVIGVPLAVSELRNRPAPVSAPPQTEAVSADELAAAADRPGPQASSTAPSPPVRQAAPPARTEPAQPADDTPRLAGAAPVPVVADVAAVPAAPPPPSAAMAVADVDGPAVAEAQDVVVTGSRLARPDLTASNSFEMQSSRAARSAQKAAEPDYAAVLSRLQGAVRSDDRRAVIALIRFPLRVGGPAGERTYRNAPAVERDFDRIFTPRVQDAILLQRAELLRVTDRAVSLGNGAVRMEGHADGSVKIVRVRP